MKWSIEIPTENIQNERFIKVGYEHANGIKQNGYTLSIDELIEALIGLRQSNYAGAFLDSPLLSDKCIRFKQSADGMFYEFTFLYEAINVYTNYYDRVYGFIEFPKTMFKVRVQVVNGKYRLMKEQLFVIKDDVISDDTEIYHYPFPHVNQEKHEICWGDNGIKTKLYTSVSELQELYKKFIQSPFTDDYQMKMLDVANNFGLYITNNEDAPFDYEQLIPTNLKFSDL